MSENADRSLRTTSSLSNKLFYWLPPLLWMAAIFWFSTDFFSASHTSSILGPVLRWLDPYLTEAQAQLINFCIRKTAHFTEYAIFALLWLRAFRSGSLARWQFRWALYSFLIVSVYALLDEYHQSFTRLRSASVYDSFIDMSGGLVALLVVWLINLRRARQNSRSTRRD